VLSQGCRALGVLALSPENRTRIAAANGIKILVHILQQAQTKIMPGVPSNTNRTLNPCVSELVQEAALVAFANLM